MFQTNERLDCPPLTQNYGGPYWRAILDHYYVLKDKKNAEAFLSQTREHPPCRPTWCDLFLAEIAALRLLPKRDLGLRIARLREEFRVLYGDRLYAQYMMASAPKESEDDLRADACYLLREIQRMRLGYSALQKLQDVIGLIAGGIMVVAFVLALAAFEGWSGRSGLSLLIPVLVLGATGGVISLLQRTHGLPATAAPVVQVGILHLGIMPAYRFALGMLPALCAIEGAVGAGILYLLFQGGILSGTLFPNLTEFMKEPTASHLLTADLAKLLVWSFLAGFSERLVPDFLGQLTKRAEREGAAFPPGPQGPGSSGRPGLKKTHPAGPKGSASSANGKVPDSTSAHPRSPNGKKGPHSFSTKKHHAAS